MRIHFIGIGGIGVSALAQYYLAKGYKVSGSDLVESEITKALENLGAKIFIGKHKAENLPRDVDIVIYSPAIQETNPELKQAYQIRNTKYEIPNTKYQIRIISYPEALGELTKKYFTIAVCGSHGKSTTASMIGLTLIKAGFDPTVIVGTKLKEFGDSNCRVGESKYLVIEADEYKESFLNYWPKIIVLTNLEPDHLDYYKNFKNYKNVFREFISHLPKNGVLVANKDDPAVYSTFSTAVENVLWYSLKDKESKKLKKRLKIPGKFNVSNALAALTTARVLKIPDKISFQELSEYRGSWRRFEILKKKPFILVSDYGHHPTEIKATLEAAREKYPKKKIWLVFQPHQYQRTYYLFKDFVKVFKKVSVDKTIITDIYDVAGREDKKIKKKINSEKLVQAINSKKVIYLSFPKIIDYLKNNLKGGEVVILMGAGSIYKLTAKIKENFLPKFLVKIKLEK